MQRISVYVGMVLCSVHGVSRRVREKGTLDRDV